MKEKFHVQYLTIYAQLYYAHKDPNFGMHMDILTNFRLSGKNLQSERLEKKYSEI